jgi:hypothetical protein
MLKAGQAKAGGENEDEQLVGRMKMKQWLGRTNGFVLGVFSGSNSY